MPLPGPLRILHVSKYDVKGGAALAALGSVRAQRAIGLDARMVVGRKLGDAQFVRGPGRLGDLAALARFSIERLPFRIVGLPATDTRSMGVIGVRPGVLLGSDEPDIIVLHNIDGILRIEDLPRLPCPVIWRMHDMWAIQGTSHYAGSGWRIPPKRLGRFERHLDAWTVDRKHRAIRAMSSLTFAPPSRWLAQAARSAQVCESIPIEVIPNGVDIDVFRPVDRAAARSAFGLTGSDFVVLFGAASGTGDPRKGFDLLEAGLRSASSSLASMRLKLVTFGGGDGLIDSIAGQSVRSVGKILDRERLCKLYAAADVTVVPSREENLSLTVLESMASGTPVIAFDVGGMPDIIVSGVNGWLASPFDSAKLGRLIVNAVRGVALMPALRKAARETVVDEFSSEVEACRMESLFRRVLGN